MDEQSVHADLTINEDDLASLPDVAAPLKATRIRNEDVWREIVKSSNGRDKALVRCGRPHPAQTLIDLL